MHGYQHVVAAGNNSPLVVHHTVGKQVTDHWDGVTGEGQLPAHGQGHCSAEKQKKAGRTEELHRDHFVIGVPEIMYDPWLSVAMAFVIPRAVLHGEVGVVGDGCIH